MIFFVPLVNIDSYVYINENWRNPFNSERILMIRKNRHLTNSCDALSGGVDLNRNYSFKFAMDDEGSSPDPCQEDYRGEFPFSEPEIASLKNYIDHHPQIVSGVNIHTYGNSWIYPFNFSKDKYDSLLQSHRKIYYDFFKEFEKKVKVKQPKTFFGNAAFTLDYSTNGEAGDWLTGAKNILNLDVELGNADTASNKFYPPRVLIDKILRYNWVTMKDFLYEHIVNFHIKKLTLNHAHKRYKFHIMNCSLSSAKNF